jgi:hypothetical protein
VRLRTVLRISGLRKCEEAAGGWREPHNEELLNLYSLLRIIKMITSRRMRWTVHVAQMEKRNAYRYW